MNENYDIELLKRLKQGDSTAFKLLYDRYWEALYLYCFQLSGQQDIAGSIIQDFFIQLWEKRKTLEISNPKSYFFKSVKNQLFKYYRDNKFKMLALEERFEEFVEEQPIENIDSELLKRLQSAIERLPKKRKEVLMMNKVQGMSNREIAEELQVSEQTVKNQLTLSLKQLRLEFKNVSWLIIVAYFLDH